MRKIKEILRLTAAGLSIRAVAASVSIGHGTVGDYVRRAARAGLSWPAVSTMADADLEQRLFRRPAAPLVPRPLPDWRRVHDDLARKRRTGVTLLLLWEEYKAAHPTGLAYSQFAARYRAWRGTLDLVLRQEHAAGEKAFVDFAGQTVPIVDRTTGEVLFEAAIFVGVLGASSYTFAEAFASQTLPDWLTGHTHMVEFFGGVPHAVVPDNLKAGVRRPCYYEPDINPSYHEWAVHHGTAVLPARVRKPRDKAKAEAAVQLVQRWILAALRHQTFGSLAELNAAIRPLLTRLNAKPFQKLDGSRRSRFETIDRPALRPLPATRYEFTEWKRARVNIDYHVDIFGHYYSVPYTLARQSVDARLTPTTVEILHGGRRVASHRRQHKRGGFTTDPAHRPKAHERYLEWTPSRILSWAKKTGPHTAMLAQQIMTTRPHPEQGFRACLGIMRLGQRYGDARLEAAAARSLRTGAVSYRAVESILKKGLEDAADTAGVLTLPATHEHLRGPEYYALVVTGDHAADHPDHPDHPDLDAEQTEERDAAAANA